MAVVEGAKVGGEVDSYCTKDKMVLAHTILAMVGPKIARVKCNTCGGEHAYKANPPGVKAPKAPKPKKAKAKPSMEKPTLSSYEALMADKDPSRARPYSIKEKYVVGDLIQHPTFGLGVVGAVRSLEKVDVAFPSGAKTLLHSKGSMPATLARALPRRVAPAVEEEGVEGAAAAPADGGAGTSDAPPREGAEHQQ